MMAVAPVDSMSFMKGLAGIIGGLIIFTFASVFYGMRPFGSAGAFFFAIGVVGLGITIIAPAYYWGRALLAVVKA